MADAVTEPGATDRGELVHHERAPRGESVALAGRDRDPEEGSFGPVGGEHAHRDGGGSVEAVVLDDDDGASPGDVECQFCDEKALGKLRKHMDSVRDEIETRASAKQPIPWSLYSSDPEKYAWHTVNLYQTDFASGTLRIRTRDGVNGR